MNRLTSNCGAIDNGKTYYPKSDFATGELQQMILNRLGAYEDTGIEPEDIEQAIIFAKAYILEVLKENKKAIAMIKAMGAGADTYEVEESSADLEKLLIKFGGQQEGAGNE